MKNARPFVVQFGAGAIGRGFLGQLWTEGNHAVTFADVDTVLLHALNRDNAYPLRLTDNNGARDLTIAPVRGVLASDLDAVGSALEQCAFACTAVGANAFQQLGAALARGVARRWQNAVAPPLNVLCCENQAGAAHLLRRSVENALGDNVDLRTYFARNVAFADASVGRMVPPPTPALLAENPLLVAAEPYAELPIDGAAWLGEVPVIPGLLPKNNFAAYVARKLFTHNGGHALLAYRGRLRGHDYIWQAAEDAKLVDVLRGFWGETGAALVRAYNLDAREQRAHEDDLLRRFRNRALGDTVARVGRDPARKLRADDRLVGAGLLCLGHGVTPHHVARVIAAALRFDEPGDPSAAHVQDAVRQRGAAGALQELASVEPDSPLARLVASAYDDDEKNASRNPSKP